MNKELYLSKFKIRPYKSPSQEDFFRRQFLASEINKWSGGKLPISMLMAWQKQKGEKFLRRVWEESRASESRDPIRLFKWKYGQCKIKVALKEKVEVGE